MAAPAVATRAASIAAWAASRGQLVYSGCECVLIINIDAITSVTATQPVSQKSARKDARQEANDHRH